MQQKYPYENEINPAARDALAFADQVTQFMAYQERVNEIRDEGQLADQDDVQKLCDKLLARLLGNCDYQREMYRDFRQQVPNFADLYETPKTDDEKAAVATLLWKMRSKKQDCRASRGSGR